MSCRDWAGNSAVTSLAKFLTRTPEKTGSHLFHVIKKEAMLAMGKDGRASADTQPVLLHLERVLQAAQHDVRVPEARRGDLVERAKKAIEMVTAGERVPDKATFYAWQHLEARLEADPSAKATVRHGRAVVAEFDDTAGTTPDGLVVTASDVEKAKSEYETLLRTMNAQLVRNKKMYSDTDRQAHKRLALEVAAARDRFERMQGAYDSTDTGYEALKTTTVTVPGIAPRVMLRERLKAAEARRSTEPEVVQYQKAAAVMDPAVAKTKRDQSAEQVRKVENTYRTIPTDANRKAYETAVAEYRVTQRTYLYALMSRPEVSLVTKSGDLRSTQAWASLEQQRDVDRVDLWRAVDLYASDMDKAEIRIGRINEVEGIRRGLQRAEARQAVLDSEGGGKLDPINRRFAESLKRKRGIKN